MDTSDAPALARVLLAKSLPLRWRHVQGVAHSAARIAEHVPLDRDAVIAAAWLHDVGYSSELRDTGFHPLDGARYLRRAGWPEPVCRLVAHHTAARVEALTHGLVDQLDAEFPDAASLERDALWVADATTGPDGQTVTIDERIAEIGRRYGAQHHVTLAMQASREQLQAALERIEQHRAERVGR